MIKSEKLNWTIAIVGLVASLISIFAFLTGAQSIPGIVRKPEPKPTPTIIVQNAPVAVPPAKVDTPGDKGAAPLKNLVNWTAGRFKKPSHKDVKAPDAPAAPEKQ